MPVTMNLLNVLIIICLASKSLGDNSTEPEEEEVCTPCGCFNNDPPFERFYPLPQDIGIGLGKQRINWRLFTPRNPENGIDIDFDDVEMPAEYDPLARTVFVMHGWNAPPISSIKAAYFDAGFDYNVVLLDWPGGRMLRYWQCAANARVAGACSALLASRMVESAGADLANMQCIGHSLGGQVCGFMGKSTNGTIGRVTGLDPAGPWFNKDDPRGRIDKDDGQFVDIIHTSGGRVSLGLYRQIGDVDFFPNKGYNQPPCPAIGSCDHNIVGAYWRASLLSASENCTFTANPCASEEDADDGLCETCEADVDCQRMGHYAETMPGRGVFYLRTTPDSPYCEN